VENDIKFIKENRDNIQLKLKQYQHQLQSLSLQGTPQELENQPEVQLIEEVLLHLQSL